MPEKGNTKKRTMKIGLNTLVIRRDKRINNLKNKKGKREVKWVKYEATLDSGSCENVADKNQSKYVQVRQNKNSEEGVEYVAANGVSMKNRGEKEIELLDVIHRKKKLISQITDVKTILISESKVSDAGHWIWRDEARGAIVNKTTGVETPFVRKEVSTSWSSGFEKKLNWMKMEEKCVQTRT